MSVSPRPRWLLASAVGLLVTGAVHGAAAVVTLALMVALNGFSERQALPVFAALGALVLAVDFGLCLGVVLVVARPRGGDPRPPAPLLPAAAVAAGLTLLPATFGLGALLAAHAAR